MQLNYKCTIRIDKRAGSFTTGTKTKQGPPKKPLRGNLQGFEWNQCQGRKEDR